MFFEMLDVDGSDLKMLTIPARLALPPSATDDDDGVRRVVMQLIAVTWLTTASLRLTLEAAVVLPMDRLLETAAYAELSS